MKKKMFMCALLCACFGVTDADAQKSVKETFYGEKASNSTKNPCKGYCSKVCGEKVYRLMPMPDADDMPATPFSAAGTATRVIMTLTDAGGNVIDKKDTVYEGDAETIAQEIMRGKSLNSRIKEER